MVHSAGGLLLAYDVSRSVYDRDDEPHRAEWQPAYADRRYASPINLPVILMALALWAIIGLVVLLVV